MVANLTDLQRIPSAALDSQIHESAATSDLPGSPEISRNWLDPTLSAHYRAHPLLWTLFLSTFTFLLNDQLKAGTAHPIRFVFSLGPFGSTYRTSTIDDRMPSLLAPSSRHGRDASEIRALPKKTKAHPLIASPPPSDLLFTTASHLSSLCSQRSTFPKYHQVQHLCQISSTVK